MANNSIKLSCKNCKSFNIFYLDRLKFNKKVYFHCYKCGPICSSYSFYFEFEELVDYKYNLNINRVRYTVYGSKIINNTAIFLSMNKDSLIEFNKFYSLSFSENLENQLRKIIRKANKLKSFK